MRNVSAIFKREFRQAVCAPALYVVMGLFFAFTSMLFLNILVLFSRLSENASLRQKMGYASLNATMFIVNNLFGFLNFLMIFLVPVITMRLLAEERREGTLELLRAQPIRDWDILLGKYLAGVAVVGLMIALTIFYPLATVFAAGWSWDIIEWKVVWSCYLGLGLISAGFVAFGLFASSITENRIVAAVVTFLGLLFLYLAGELPGESAAWWARALSHMSIQYQADGFTSGQVLLSNLAYFGLFTVFFLFLAARVMESRR